MNGDRNHWNLLVMGCQWMILDIPIEFLPIKLRSFLSHFKCRKIFGVAPLVQFLPMHFQVSLSKHALHIFVFNCIVRKISKKFGIQRKWISHMRVASTRTVLYFLLLLTNRISNGQNQKKRHEIMFLIRTGRIQIKYIFCYQLTWTGLPTQATNEHFPATKQK